jgi:hypothetical protein
VSIGLVLGAEKLMPITWSAWAGQIEREGGARNPYRGLEERVGFWDVRVSFLLLASYFLPIIRFFDRVRGWVFGMIVRGFNGG